MTLDEVGAALTNDLNRYVGEHKFLCVGLTDNQLIIYTQTKREANHLVAFVGGIYKGFQVIGRALGPKVVLCRK